MSELSVVILAVGEPCVIQTIRNLKERTPEHELTVIYDTCGRNANLFLYDEMLALCPDTVLIRKNRGTSGAMNFGMLFCRTEYLAFVPADVMVGVDWWSKLKEVFDSDPKMAFVGDNPSLKKDEVRVNDIDFQADNSVAWRMEAVEKVGGILRAFRGYGNELTEWPRRARKQGWNFASVGKVCDNNGVELHEGRDSVSDPKTLDANCRVLLKADAMGYEGYSWWQRSL